MKTKSQLLLIVIILISGIRSGFAQSLNDIKIGHCTSATVFNAGTAANDINNTIVAERRIGLVMDARPFAVDQSTGKLLFTRGDGRVSVVHMNPFVYDYRISVAQQELVSTALSDFLKLLLPPNIASSLGQQSGNANKALRAASLPQLRGLERRLNAFKRTDPCPAGNRSCEALNEMHTIFEDIKERVAENSSLVTKLDGSEIRNHAKGKVGSTNERFVLFATDLTNLRNQQFEAYETCDRAQQLNQTLSNYDFNALFGDLNTAQQEISDITELADDLSSLITLFKNDDALKGTSPFCSGFNCIGQLEAYLTEVRNVIGAAGYERKLTDLRRKGTEMQNMFFFTEQLREKGGMFARTFTIARKFELSQATISIRRERLEQQNNASTPSTQSGTVNPPTSAETGGVGGVGGGGGGEGTIGNTFGPPVVPGQLQAGTPPAPAKAASGNSGDKPAGSTPLVADSNEVVQLGRPRFMLSGGLVFSPLARRVFAPVRGFVLDAQGNPTGKGDATVVGFQQNSPRRLLPMLFLNSRLYDYEKGSLFFTLGITAKHDKNIDIEYLVGPSVSFLNDRALFTFGAYGGLSQNLVDGVRVGDALPGSLGSDITFYRKSLNWKPGFSFSYAISRTNKVEAKGSGGGGSSTPSDDLRNEIRLGGVPFNFAIGLAVTSLEQRTYDEIAGFARDRQGNLTNGQTLARIVGVNSSSDYRMAPMAMLHTRLTNFGRHDFYFTTGLTGKKTDNDFDIEYLLGGSVNVYQRKVFLTFGTFIGKQQILGGNFFEGLGLNSSQNVTTTSRYVWKPAIGFSYDISRIIPRSN